ncbi:MAG: hypothetical protein ACFFAU_05370 [Candidatus Hodarchaeota archaeon]
MNVPSGARFKAYIIPIISVILITIILSVFNIVYYTALEEDPDIDFERPKMAFIEEDPDAPGGIALGALLNMLVYVVMVFIGGIIVLIIIKKGFMQLLANFFALLMGFSWFSLGLFYSDVSFWGFILLFFDFLPEFIQTGLLAFVNWTIKFSTKEIIMYPVTLIIIGLFLGILGTFSFGIQSFDRIWIRNIMMIFFGAMVGSLFAIHFGLLSVFFILVGLSLYDIYAVFRGPLKGIIDHSREESEEMSEMMQNNDEFEIKYERVPLLPALPVYSTRHISIGLGDFAFFSMLISASVVISDGLGTSIPLFAALIGLFAGVIYTFKLLTKDRALPGLPLPIFGGIACLVLSVTLLLIIGFVDISAIVSLFV